MLERGVLSDAKARNAPSGDHTGHQSFAALDVNRVSSPVVRFFSHISRFPLSGSGTTIASSLPSGDSRGCMYSRPEIIGALFLPVRSNHASSVFVLTASK